MLLAWQEAEEVLWMHNLHFSGVMEEGIDIDDNDVFTQMLFTDVTVAGIPEAVYNHACDDFADGRANPGCASLIAGAHHNPCMHQ